MADLPDRARVVVVGGGVIGASTAYHLAHLGWTDVLLLEQGTLSCGTTWHAAGLVGQLRASESGTRLVQYSGELYARLEEETGLSTGYKQCGGLIVARTPDRMTQLRRTAANADAYGLECAMLSPDEALERWPLMRVDDLLGAIWLPGDGTANPTDLTQALAKGARQLGGAVRERTRVTDVLVRDGAVTGVRTDRGDVEAEVVVNCAGQWAQASARWRGSACRCTRPSTSTSSPTRSRACTRPADPARPGRLDLRQGGGRRPGRRRVRARGEAVGGARRDPVPLRVRAARRGLGALRGAHGERAAPPAGARARPGSASSTTVPRASRPTTSSSWARRPEVPRLLRRRRASTRSGSRRRAAPDGRWPSGSSSGEPTSDLVARRHPALRAVPRQHAVAARAGRRGARPALRRAVAEPRARDRAAVPPLAGARPARRARRACFGTQDGLGAGQRLRARRRVPALDYTLGQAAAGSTGPTRSSAPPAAASPSSTRPRSRSTSSPGADAEATLQWSARPTSPVPSGRPSTPGCSTGAAPTSPTSP